MKSIITLVMIVFCALSMQAQPYQMKKRIINPWKWQDARSYAQAIEVQHTSSTLYISGQTAIDDTGISSTADMKTQLHQALKNLETVIQEAGYKPSNIVRLNVYTTSTDELMECFDLFQQWITLHDIHQASTLLEVQGLFENLKVELEATVVK